MIDLIGYAVKQQFTVRKAKLSFIFGKTGGPEKSSLYQSALAYRIILMCLLCFSAVKRRWRIALFMGVS
jgi:hypothetical protein